MKSKRTKKGVGGRLETGTAVLAAANVSDTKLIESRLSAFAGAQQSYGDAQRKLDAAETRLRELQDRVLACDMAQDEAVEALAGALAAAGQPRSTPFAAFGAAAPSSIKQMQPADEVKAIRGLVAAVLRKETIAEVARRAAEAAEQAAAATEAALAPLGRLEAALTEARHNRDAVGHTWDLALAALKRGARAAADDGAPGLYTALFGRMSRPSRKSMAPAPSKPVASPAVQAQSPQGGTNG